MTDLAFMSWQRGPLMEKIDREPGDSDPLPDDLVDAIAAAGLTGHDEGRCLRLYRDGQLVGYVNGCNAHTWAVDDVTPDGEPIIGPSSGKHPTLWWANPRSDEPRSEGVRWRNHLAAVRWTLDLIVLRAPATAPYSERQAEGGDAR